ncbi:cob(I)yrinic acid a,c-diamide adenosyltransferase [Aestuariimicrobium ganziense]|uniref:cob(I)yrinic acid a,c-diamide adenosyltransferase n=1 Tax=Aestuariimicrobium ganziense TaxID=2773677 RepID=UPI0019457C57|nr:cob(I)yrinic acid a,c-diamide adenosyltransferase [Aestuariimicrobium ganziense]
MVNLTRIYTRTGDRGETRLSDNSVARKVDPRVRAYGDVDEANAQIGLVLAGDDLPEPIRAALRIVQNELFDVGADLSTPVVAEPQWEPLRVLQTSIDRLEHWCDEFGEPLPNLRSFVLPGGKRTAAQLHVARTVVRRAERSAWAAADEYGLDQTTDTGEPAAEGGLNPLALTYLNRLSDLLFIMSRHVLTNGGADTDAEVLWVPGGERE